MAAMIKNFTSTFISIRQALVAGVDATADYRLDPLAHPELERMSMAELGDIPARELRAQGRA